MDLAVVDAATTTELRRAVLRPAWPVGSVLSGDADADAVHLAAIDDHEVVGACVLLPRTLPDRLDTAGWQLRGMATAESHRGRGVGTAVLDFAVEQVRERAGTLLWCGARLTAYTFYQQHGFVTVGPAYVQEETALPHVTMYRELSAPTTSS